MKRHLSVFVDNIKPIKFCDRTVMFCLDSVDVYELPFEIEPTEGEHDFNSCENCQTVLQRLKKEFTEKIEGKGNIKPFPLCCSYHANLINRKEFERKDFVNVPEMAAKKIVYTNQHITNNLKAENWYRVITDYIEYVVISFGQMPKDCGEPLFLSSYFKTVIDSVEKNAQIGKEQKTKILEFLNLYRTPANKVQTDLNVLVNAYERWFKTFPFELNSYFGGLKEHYKNQLPIFYGITETNIYTGLAKGKLHTKSSLIEALINLTNNLLTQINAVTLYEKGLLTDTDKIKLELIISRRKLKLTQGYKNNSQDAEDRYRKMVKEWLNDEIKFINEITPLLKASSQHLPNKIAAPVISLFCSIIHQSGILIQGFDESKEKYCKRVCSTYDLLYSDRVRQSFSTVMQVKEADKNLQHIMTSILPNLPFELKDKLEKYIATKTKLYG